jgi:putative peptidoglycan lipid II flippase
MLWDSGSTAVASAIGQGPALLVAPVAAFVFGASQSSDVVFLALAVATFVTTTLAGATQFAVVPFLVSASRTPDRGAAFLGRLTQLVVLASGALAIAAAWAAPAFVPSYSGASPYLWWLVPFSVLAGVTGVFVGALNARNEYWSAALSPLWRWLTVLACMVAFGRSLGPASLILGYSLGEAIRLWFLLRLVIAQYGWTVSSPGSAPRSAELVHFSRSAVAQIVASGVLALVPIIDRNIAGSLPAGAISVLEYADRVWQVPVGFAMSGLLVVVLSKWSHDLHGTGKAADVANQTRRTATHLGLIAIVPCAIAIWLREPLAALLFAHGRFPASAVPTIADTIGAYVLGIPTYLAGLTYTRAYLAQKRSGWLVVVASSELVLKLVLNPLLLRAFGLPGVALATSTMSGFGLAMLVFAVQRGPHAGDRFMSADRAIRPVDGSA